MKVYGSIIGQKRIHSKIKYEYNTARLVFFGNLGIHSDQVTVLWFAFSFSRNKYAFAKRDFSALLC